MSEPIVSFDEKAIKNELRELVRQTVEDTLNGLLEEEADDLVGAERYERTAGRQERAHAGHRQAQVRGRQRMGIEKVSRRVASGGLIMPTLYRALRKNAQLS